MSSRIASLFATVAIFWIGSPLLRAQTVLGAAPPFTGPAEVAGAVVDDDGNPVVGAIVRYGRPSSGVPAGSASVTAGSDGTFTAPQLAPGRYLFCAQDPAATLLDPCAWSPINGLVSVTPGARRAGLVLRPRRARTLQILVNDPGNILGPTAIPGVKLVAVGVFSDSGLFHPAQHLGRQGNTETYQVAVPAGASLRPSFAGTKITVTDQSGAVLNGAQPVSPVSLDATQNSLTITFTVRQAQQ